MELGLQFKRFFVTALVLLTIVQPLACRRSRVWPRRNDETMFLNPAVREMFRYRILTDAELSQDKVTRWSNGQDMGALPQSQSSCPSTLFMRHNPNRVPSITFEAHCTQQQCSSNPQQALPSLNKAGKTFEGLAGLTSRCSPITYYRWVKVISRTAHGKRRMEHRLLGIPVGCTCSSDPIKHVTSAHAPRRVPSFP